jgi:hypothetical protein
MPWLLGQSGSDVEVAPQEADRSSRHVETLLMSHRSCVLAVASICAALACSCHGGFDRTPCEGVTCSGHGRCFESGDDALCMCDEGYAPDQLECVPDGVDGDADDDADADLEPDADPVEDSDLEPDGDADEEIDASQEVCNGVDDDGDGQVDEGLVGGPCETACGVGVGQCEGGTWECSVPDACECTPAGSTETRACGRCGSQSRECLESLTWGGWGTCDGEGDCMPGDVSSGGCDQCSQQVCAEDCRWGACTLISGNECEYRDGTNYRCCGVDRVQYCAFGCFWWPCSDCTTCGC